MVCVGRREHDSCRRSGRDSRRQFPYIAFYDVSPVEPLFGAINFLRSQASADSVRSKWCMTSSRLSVLKDVANTRPEAKRVELANPPEGLSGPQGF